MSRMSAAELATAVGAKFEPFIIGLDADEEKGLPEQDLTLRHLLRLPKPVREEFDSIQEAKNQRDEQLDAAQKRVEARDKALAERAEVEARIEELEANDIDPAAFPTLPVVPELEEGDEDTHDGYEENLQYLRDIISCVADSKVVARRWLDEVGDDLAMLSFVFAEWFKKTQPGEAPSSAS